MHPSSPSSPEPAVLLQDYLLSLWSAVLGRPQHSLSANENFFAAGGDSLSATMLLARFNAFAAAHETLPQAELSELFEYPSVREFVSHLLTKIPLPDYEVGIPEQAGNAKYHPASIQQQGLYFLQSLAEDSTAYNCACAFDIHGRLCVSSLSRALQETVRQHDILRSVYLLRERQLCCHALPAEHTLLQFTDLSALPGQEREAAVRDLLRHTAMRPFDLAAEWPVRAQLIKIQDNAYVLLICVHHIAMDGISTAILMAEISRRYAACGSGTEQKPAHSAWQYRDYCLEQSQLLTSEYCRKQSAKRISQLRVFSFAPVLPENSSACSTAVSTAQVRHTCFDLQALAGIHQFCRRQRLTLFMFLQTLFALSLHIVSNRTQIVMGAPVCGRTRDWHQSVIGYFSNMLILPLDFSRCADLPVLFSCNRRNILQALEHQHIPFSHLVQQLNPQRKLQENPLFQVSFALNNFPRPDFCLEGLKIHRHKLPPSALKFDLELEAETDSSGLQLQWRFSGKRTDAGFVDAVREKFTLLVLESADRRAG